MPSALYIAEPKAQKKGYVFQRNPSFCWSERHDSNMRHPAPKAGALPSCATLRHTVRGMPAAKRILFRLQEGLSTLQVPKMQGKNNGAAP